MRIRAAKFTVTTILLTLILMGCTKTEKEVVTVPTVEKIEVPVVIPSTSEVVTVPQYIMVDKSVGLKSLPKKIKNASDQVKLAGKAVAKVFSLTGASGTGFFISADGLFLTNEHVIPTDSCVNRRCPGYKIVSGFYAEGTAQTYTDFEVLAQDGNNYDFTLLKVHLKDGEKVQYFDLQLEALDQLDTDPAGSAVVLGHPGGASLHFAEAKPFEIDDVNIIFQATVIPGNSGGPLVDIRSNKVIGLVKSMRTMPSKDGLGGTYFKNLNQATSIWALNKLIQDKTGNEILKVSETTDMRELQKTSASLAKPDGDDFGSLFRRSPSDLRNVKAFPEFIKLIGTGFESEAIDLMAQKSEKFQGRFQLSTLNKFLQISLSLGRPLRISKEALDLIEQDLKLFSAQETQSTRILLYFFDETKRNAPQISCLGNIPAVEQALLMAPFNCFSNSTADGKSIFPAYADWLVNKSKISSLDQLSSVYALLMFASSVGISSEEDLSAVTKINDYVEQKASDIEVLMRNDGSAMGLIKKVLGLGAFKDTFPDPR